MLRATVDIFFESCTVPTLPGRMTCRMLEYFVNLHSNSFGRSIFLEESEGRKTVWHYFFISKLHVWVNYHLMKWHFFLRSALFLHLNTITCHGFLVWAGHGGGLITYWYFAWTKNISNLRWCWFIDSIESGRGWVTETWSKGIGSDHQQEKVLGIAAFPQKI